MVSDDDIRAALRAEGLEALADRVVAATRAEVWITATPDEHVPVGASRIGGAPDLPRGTPWPRFKFPQAPTAQWPDYARRDLAEARATGVVTVDNDDFALALPFVAQLDLADLAPFQDRLPRRGRLWLFVDQMTDAGEVGGYPTCASACLHAPDLAPRDLERVAPPPTPDTLAALALAFARGRSFPDPDDLGLGGDAWNRYLAAIHPFAQREPRHGSFTRAEYGSIALVPPEGYTTILVVDSDYAIDPIINFGDAGTMTFAIPDAALADGRFDEVVAFRWIG